MSTEKDIDFVLRTVEERDIRFVRLWFTDVLGTLKSFAISPEELEEAFEEGIGFDGSSIDGFARLEESDMLAFPDAETFQLLPWRPTESGVARVFCNICTPSREPFAGDPRGCLERVFERADREGYVFNVGPKIEYFYFDNDVDPVPLDTAGYFDLTPSDVANDLRRQTTLTLEKMSVPVQYSFHGGGPSQNVIELRFTEAVSCADNIMSSRLVHQSRTGWRPTGAVRVGSCPSPSRMRRAPPCSCTSRSSTTTARTSSGRPRPSTPRTLSELAQHFVAGPSPLRARVHAGHQPPR